MKSSLRSVIAFAVVLFALVVLSFGLFSCGDKDDPGIVCDTPAIVKDLSGLDGCGYVFELPDGTRLEPLLLCRCSAPIDAPQDPLDNFEFVDGKQVVISYEIVEDAIFSVCMAGKAARITCLTEPEVVIQE